LKPITVVIPVFNQCHLTERCLESVFRNSSQVDTIHVIDNASTDTTAEVLKRWQLQFQAQGISFEIHSNEINQGFGRACNIGIRAAQTDYVAVLNNDTWLMPNWDHALLQSIQLLRADMVGPFYDETPFNSSTQEQRAQSFIEKNTGQFRREFVSILIFFKRSSLDHVGHFDERFFVTYEDTDLKHRMDQSKMTYYMVGNCYIWHHSKGTRSNQNLPSNYEKEGHRLFLEKWGFDPIPREHTLKAKLIKSWRKWKKARLRI
jgi:GT2 family glycosyltransferase